jgi:ribosomal protein S18 acetylase RimI-like enzyme
MLKMTIRPVHPNDPDDLGFLRLMLYEAVCWLPQRRLRSLDNTLADPQLRHYVDGWGRPGDGGMIAEQGGERLGAAWFRLFGSDDPGYGFIDEHTPELSIAVIAPRRGQGIGHALLQATTADLTKQGFLAVSLSVEADNPALRLYERVGFERIAPEGGSWVMLATL